MKTILVVDDEDGLTEMLRAVLSDLGYRVVTAPNGLRALERLGETHPDLAIVDYMMPVLDGPALVRRMHREPEFRDVPVVVISAVAEGAAGGRFDGYAAYLQKPFRLAHLVAVVSRLVGAAA